MKRERSLTGAVVTAALLGFCVEGIATPDAAPDIARGTLMLTQFVTAPFPHPRRATGYKHDDDFFSAAERYQDSTVALFVPPHFHAESNIDFVVHFHGWHNNVTNALASYLLTEQFAASGRNAILIVPQGPRDAADSFGGKLEDPSGFTRFMAEAVQTLRDHGIVENGAIGKIVLSAHSGGYEVVSSIVACGGLTDHVTEIWLFDALYGRTERFALWFDHHSGRFIDLYTDHGGTKEETENLMAALRGNDVEFYAGNEGDLTPENLRRNHLVFLHCGLPHDDVLRTHRTFQTFLSTSSLKEVVYKAAPNP
jgi:hypothetical protein